MKRLLGILSCLLVMFAGLASAWASCKQVTIASDGHHASSISGRAHEHHSHSNHDHSGNTVVHCSTLAEFIPTPTFVVKADSEEKRLSDPIGAEFATWFNDAELNALVHDPPTLVRCRTVAFHLFFSVLRI
jgi:hypothetical protein